jgi:hypothetical protein
MATEMDRKGPAGQAMSDEKFAIFAKNTDLLVKETRKGCCSSENVYRISTLGAPQTDIMVATENSSCCCRNFCGKWRSLTIDVTLGGSAGGQKIATFERPYRCMPGSCCYCLKCCQQEMIGYNHDRSHSFGRTWIPCFVCTPEIWASDEKGNKHFELEPDSGCCKCCTRTFKLGIKRDGTEVGEIKKLDKGFFAEARNDDDNFIVKFPTATTPEQRVNLLGATFLLNMVYFEGRSPEPSN